MVKYLETALLRDSDSDKICRWGRRGLPLARIRSHDSAAE